MYIYVYIYICILYMYSFIRYTAYDMRHVDVLGLFLKCRETKSHNNSFVFRPVFDGMRPF